MKKNRVYSQEFKREIIQRIDSGEISLSGAARENNISPTLIDRWRTKIHEGTMPEKPTIKEKQLEKELEQYKKKVGELTLQIDLLKKVCESTAYMKRQNGYIVTGKTSVSKKDAE
jgi:transposase-like protein